MILNKNQLVEGRECDECTVCCVSLKINEPELKKPADVRCDFLTQASGCSIYENRPPVCRSWYCGWRGLAEVDESMRPDKSGLMVKLIGIKSVSLMLIKGRESQIFWDARTLEMICKLRDQGFAIFTSVPTKTGFCNAQTNIDQQISNDLIKKAPDQAIDLMKQMYFQTSHASTKPDLL